MTGDWTRPIECSVTAQRTTNPIRAIVDKIVIPAQAAGKPPYISLALGDPTVYAHLRTPEQCVDACVESLHSFKFNGYPPSTGYEFARDAVARAYSVEGVAPLSAADVVICSGCSGALDIAITALTNAGQNILLPRPGFSLYQTLAESKGIECRYYNLLPERHWEIDLEHLRSLADSNTAAIIVNNPSNPCGSVWSRAHMEQVVAAVESLRLPLIADEIYADMAFAPHQYIPFAAVSKTVPVLSVGGIAKRYMVPGWRLGWILVHDRNNLFSKIRHGLTALSQLILGANSLVQSVLPKLLHDTPAAFYTRTLDILQNNAELSRTRLSQIDGLRCIVPQGAMYMMVGIELEKFRDIVDDVDFTGKLVAEENVLCLPGQCFKYPNYFRIVICAPKETLNDAYDRIEAFCQRHRANK